MGENGFEKNDYSEDTGILLIGDKVFAVENDYPFSYDLATEWINFTDRHFVFAAWVSRLDLDDQIIADFNSTLNSGLDHNEKVVKDWQLQDKFRQINVRDYLTKNISYSFDEKKKAGLELFLRKAGFSSYNLTYK